MDRRTFLKNSLFIGGSLVGVGLAVPGVVTIMAPGLRPGSGGSWVAVGSLDRFPAGTTKGALVTVPGHTFLQSERPRLIYVRHEIDGAITAFARNCTDLSCPVNWDPGSETFLCPCHGGIFDREGHPLAGPPNRSLFRFNHRVVGQILEIDIYSVPPIS